MSTSTQQQSFFAILHGLTLLVFATRALKEPTSVVLFLVLFGAIRVAGLGMEAVAEDPNLGTLPIVVASGALYDGGIFALLYAAYMLVLKRGVISGNVIKNGVSRITSNAHFFRSILAIGVIFAVSTWACYFQAVTNYDGTTTASLRESRDLINTAWYLEEVCVNIFLFATVILAVQTLFVLSAERTRSVQLHTVQQLTPGEPPEPPYAKHMPFLIVVLLLVHGIYRTISISMPIPQAKLVGYLVGVLPEWLAVLFFSAKGLIPPRKIAVPPVPGHGKEFVLA